MIEIILININNITNKIDEFFGQNSENHSNRNKNNSTKYPKFISVFINDKSSHFK